MFYVFGVMRLLVISVFAGVVAHYLLTVGDEGRTDENEWMGGRNGRTGYR